jgi:hypothetical protein
MSKKTHQINRAGGVAQGVGPELKTNIEKKKKKASLAVSLDDLIRRGYTEKSPKTECWVHTNWGKKKDKSTKETVTTSVLVFWEPRK